MQKSFWWWQCSDRYIYSPSSPHLHIPFPPFSPSLISLTVSVDVKHNVYLRRAMSSCPLHPMLRPSGRPELSDRDRPRGHSGRPELSDRGRPRGHSGRPELSDRGRPRGHSGRPELSDRGRPRGHSGRPELNDRGRPRAEWQWEA